MSNFEYLEKKYKNKLNRNVDFSDFLQKVLEEYFEENNLLDRLFDIRNEENRIISDKEIEFVDAEENIYNKLLFLCGREKKDELDKIILLIEENKQNSIDFYTREFYKLGIKDGKSLK